MDVSAIKGTGAQQPTGNQTSALRAEDAVASLSQKSEVDAEKVEVVAVEQEERVLADEERFAQVEQAAKAMVNNMDHFVVSDTKFTIFKDATGQYITRFTSLRDGSVTYIPEPEIMKYAAQTRMPRESLVEIKA
ncbi:MAG: hypothetical protein MRY32_07575 [Rickettsiales bacterium]|nr:hypothetical protein [Rickettsiales bacterium]